MALAMGWLAKFTVRRAAVLAVLFAAKAGLALVIPNPLWSTQSLAEVSGWRASLIAWPLLCYRKRDRERVIPALVEIATAPTGQVFRQMAARSLCRWRALESVPLLAAAVKRRLGTEQDWTIDGGVEALVCLGPLAKDAAPELLELAKSAPAGTGRQARAALARAEEHFRRLASGSL
jgi:hypothetical protein